MNYQCPSLPPPEKSLLENEANTVSLFLLRQINAVNGFLPTNMRLLVSLQLDTTRGTPDGIYGVY